MAVPGVRDYTVGWVCALSTEAVAARQFLDAEHQPLCYQDHQDNNSYTLGRIGNHNVVIAVLPKGIYGNNSAAGVMKDMLYTFPNIRIGLLVGVGGGAPSENHDIRLGDIVVSTPENGISGVIQYDFGKETQDQDFRVTGLVNHPPNFLLTAVSKLKSLHDSDGHQINEMVDHVLQKRRTLHQCYGRPDPKSDRLYRPEVVHPDYNKSCLAVCGTSREKLITRTPRRINGSTPVIHYGVIASANRVIKNALFRNVLSAKYNILCFDMEAAGLLNHFPCLVIRGICDYSDSHKTKE
ncbi:purine and uridine phosphorylase [Aspergillus ambiguus]|uniref:purine and uridine phosphorylase n=1 Tax=Aspergillus ambiguus TaxID=176160 RepID=UPI003CCE1533